VTESQNYFSWEQKSERICVMRNFYSTCEIFHRSGKSSIEKVVFHKMSPHETLFLEPTNDVRVREINHNLLVRLQVLDFPGNFDFHEEDDLDVDKIFKSCGALVLVIDAQDEPYTEAVDYVVKIIETAHKVNICFDFCMSY
jgi:Ras-related GTP-binding protein C/D